MKHIEILDRNFKRLCFMDNSLEQGLNYFDDKLSTSIEGGVYTLDFTVDKKSLNHRHLIEGHFVTFLNDQNVRILLTIMNVEETGNYKKVYCEDASLNLINRVVESSKKPDAPQAIGFYITPLIIDTGWTIGKNESTKKLDIEYSGTESLLSRIRKITQDFGVEFYFETKLDDKDDPIFLIHIVDRRVEGQPGFRVSSDDFLEGITRKVSIDNVVTRLFVKQRESSTPTTSTTAPSKNANKKQENPVKQPTAGKYNQSIANDLVPIRTAGWDMNWVDQFKMNQADPPYLDGRYINIWLFKFYPDSKLNGWGESIKAAADYFGISVGAALGVWAKETTFGRGEPGKSHNNFGCITWTQNSLYDKVYFGDRYWNSYPSVRVGIIAWFKLIRDVYLNQGQVTYRDFLNKYSPSFENNQATFKNLMWGTLKALGYDTSDTTVKSNYSKPTDDPRNFQFPQYRSLSDQSTKPTKSIHDERIDKLIEWFQQRKGRVTYSMQYRNGPNSYDCSSAVYSALIYAGFKPKGTWLGSTVTLWGEVGSLIREISRSEARRGDIFLSGPRGAASAGAAGHTGVFLSNSQIIHCNYADNGISVTGVQGRAGSPLYCFRLIDKTGGATVNPSQPSSKVEQAVQNCLAGVGRTPYVWGGISKNGWDCSGMVYNAYRAAGFPINHRCTTYTIQQQTYPFYKISSTEARRGDLVIQHNGGHVAVLLGPPNSGKGIVHAANESLGTITQTSITNVNGYYRVREG